MSLLPGDLILARINAPTSSKEPTNPVVNRLKLTWKPQLVNRATATNAISVRSREFQLGEQSFPVSLELELIARTHCELYLQVPVEFVDGIIGRVVVHVNQEETVSDGMMRKTNVVNGNKWILPTEQKLRFIAVNLVYNIEIDMEVVIIERNQNQELVSSESKIMKDLASMLLDKDSTDITLKVGTTKLRAHKFILSTRSPVLKAMLSADMLEGRNGVIKLQNMGVAAAQAFLSFIYTTQIERKELVETAEELLAAAVMYDMPDLLAFSESALRETLTVENVGRRLLLACLHEAVRLKTEALFVVRSNKAAVTASDGWKEAVDANPKVMFKAIINIV